jgi:hypothetical protein
VDPLRELGVLHTIHVAMTRRLVASREYKVTLLPDRFAGSEYEARQAVGELWA